MSGEIIAIFTSTAAQAPMASVEEVLLEPGKGLVGDRYYRETGTFSDKLKGQRDSEVTLIESEEVERFNQEKGLRLGLGDLRRNLVTRDVRLKDLVGRQFQIGDVVLEGVRLCEPCGHLAKTVTPEVLPGLVHRAGLRAFVVSGGVLRSGDKVVSASGE